MKNKKLLKILVLVLIAAALVAVWSLKNIPVLSSSEKGSIQTSAIPESEGDFALEASEIDLDALKEYGLPIIIDFGADSCLPCREMYPVLETMNAEMQGKAIIKFVDVWKNSEVAADFPIQVIPTQFFYNSDGSPYVPSDTIGIDFTLYSSKTTNEHVFTVHQGGLTEDQMKAILEDMGVSQ